MSKDLRRLSRELGTVTIHTKDKFRKHTEVKVITERVTTDGIRRTWNIINSFAYKDESKLIIFNSRRQCNFM